jgi:hypothetical protein
MVIGWYGVFFAYSVVIWGQDPPWKSMVMRDPNLIESSGLAESSRAGIFWTHNDSGDRARLFAVEPHQGTLGQVHLEGIDAADWEAMGTCEQEGENWIFVADCGDNSSKRDSIQIYKFLEPPEFRRWTIKDDRANQNVVTIARKQIQQIDVSFVDGPRDCEAIFIDPASSRIVLLAKSLVPSVGLYEVSINFNDLSTNAKAVASRICTINVPMATDMAVDRSNGDIVVASYLHAFWFPARLSSESISDQMKRLPVLIELPPLEQIEACAIDRKGNLWVSSEGDPMGMAELNRDSLDKLKRAQKEKP